MIAIDLREPIKERARVQQVFTDANIPSAFCVLPCADYSMITSCTRVGVERKTPDDMVSSFIDGRLARQMNAIIEEYQHAVLLVDGYFKCNDRGVLETKYGETPIKWSAFSSVMRTVQQMGVVLDYCPSHIYYPRHLLDIYRYYNTPVHRSMRTKPETVARVTPQLTILSSFPGLGVTRAEAVLKKYVTLEDAFANMDKWVEVDGVGPKTVEGVRRVWQQS
ncbi:MAG: hypothetical protein LUO93_05945 [Methanomicrobiales archaeon]|nr:hypothetical protein [Methanomicrobiales archaeon]